MIPIAVGALGTIQLMLEKNLRNIGVDTSIELMQRSALLGTAFVEIKTVDLLN